MNEREIHKIASFVGNDGIGCNRRVEGHEELEHNGSEQKSERRIAKGNRHVVLYKVLSSNKNSDKSTGKNIGRYAGRSAGKSNDKRTSEPKQLSKEYSPDILVDLTASEQNHYSANFFQNGHKIQRCGSGYLAAAHIIFEGINSDTVSLHTSSGPILLRRHRNNISFQMPVLAYQHAVCVRGWKNLLNRSIVKVILVGGENDYCILELNHEKDVKTCRVNSRRLCRYSKRGLIVTAKSTQKKDDYVLRYFAPQYGQNEDPATGSANSMVGRYWQQRLQKRKVQGRQLSDSGGEFIVEKCGLQQRVIGRTRMARP